MTSRTRAEFFLLATTLIWGSTFVAMKIGLRDMGALSMIAIRFAAAAAILGLVIPRKIFPFDRKMLLRGGTLGFLLFLGFAAQTIGLHYTTASKSAFITSLMVVFAPLLQVLIERKSPTVGNVLGIFIVCVGLWMLTSPETGSLNIGDLLTLGCSFVFGLYIVQLDVVSRQIPTLKLSFLQALSCAFFAWVAAFLVESASFVPTTESVLVIVYLTIFATVVTLLVQTRYQKDTTPTRAVIIFSIEPLFATVLAYLVLNEVIGTGGIVGGVSIIAGILISELSDMIPILRNPLWISQ